MTDAPGDPPAAQDDPSLPVPPSLGEVDWMALPRDLVHGLVGRAQQDELSRRLARGAALEDAPSPARRTVGRVLRSVAGWALGFGQAAARDGARLVGDVRATVHEVVAWRPDAAFWASLRAALLAAMLYLGLALYLMRPVLGSWSTAYIGSGEIEGWLWRYWWMKRLILGAVEAGRPLYAAYVALVSSSYPETGNVFDLQWFSMPLEALVGAPAYYNLKAVLFLVLNGLAGYWLGRTLVADWTASVLCGLTFGFGSYGLLELDTGRIRHLALFPMALYAIAVLRLQAARFALGRAVLAGLAFGLCSSVYLYYGMSVLFFSFLWLFGLGHGLTPAGAPQRTYRQVLGLWWMALLLAMAGDASPRAVGLLFAVGVLAVLARLAGSSTGRCALRAIAMMAVVGALSSAPYATWYLEQTFLHRQALREVSYFQAFPSLATLLEPQNVHTSDDNLLNSLQRFRGDSPSWDMLFQVRYRRSIPVALVALAGLGLLFGRRRPWLWLSTAVLAYLLSLGPYVRQGLTEEYVRDLGPLAFEGGISTLHPLFFKYVPYFSRLFSPIRMEGLFVLGFCVVVAWSAALLMDRLRLGPRLRPLVLLLIGGGVVWQMQVSGQARLSTTEIQVPEVYTWLVRQDVPGIIELPYREGDFVNYYQIFHQKRILGNWAAGSLPPGYPDGKTASLAYMSGPEVTLNPLLHWLRQQNDVLEGQSEVPVRRADIEVLVQAGYRYAILHERGSYVVRGNDGRAHYERLHAALVRRFGVPVHTCKEVLRDRAMSPEAPYTQGGASFDVAVFDLANDLQPPAQASTRPGGASSDPPSSQGGVPPLPL